MTATSLGCSPSTIYADQTTVCSAAVSAIVGTAAVPPVSFTAHGSGWTFSPASCTNSSGTETCTSTFTPGSYGDTKIDASFAGNASNAGSAGEVGLIVESTVVVSCSGTDAWTCTTTVTDHRTLPSSPTGTITLTGGVTGGSSSNLGSCTLQASISPGVSRCSIDNINPHGSTAQWTLTATYPGDGVHVPGSATTTYQYPA